MLFLQKTANTRIFIKPRLDNFFLGEVFWLYSYLLLLFYPLSLSFTLS
ncbi:hypothetical protein PSOS111911_10505 [Pseudoalteromonas ostreae]